MEAVGIVAAVAALFTAIGVVFAVLGLRGLQRTRRFVAASASATVQASPGSRTLS